MVSVIYDKPFRVIMKAEPLIGIVLINKFIILSYIKVLSMSIHLYFPQIMLY